MPQKEGTRELPLEAKMTNGTPYGRLVDLMDTPNVIRKVIPEFGSQI